MTCRSFAECPALRARARRFAATLLDRLCLVAVVFEIFGIVLAATAILRLAIWFPLFPH
jgi:hypothetical protein